MFRRPFLLNALTLFISFFPGGEDLPHPNKAAGGASTEIPRGVGTEGVKTISGEVDRLSTWVKGMEWSSHSVHPFSGGQPLIDTATLVAAAASDAIRGGASAMRGWWKSSGQTLRCQVETRMVCYTPPARDWDT